jgi:hypothetical protein
VDSWLLTVRKARSKVGWTQDGVWMG